MSDLLTNPYSKLINYAESMYPKTGEKVFKYLALQPVSMVAPPLPYFSKSQRATIHTLILGKSGAAKSMISNLYGDIALNPWKFKSATKAYARDELKGRNNVSMIVDDVSSIMKDQRLMKLMEGILEEQKVSDGTKTSGAQDYHINAALTGMGVFSDLADGMYGGMLFRLVPVAINLQLGEQLMVGRHISENIGAAKKEGTQLEQFQAHYTKIYENQNVEGKNRDFPVVIGYEMSSQDREHLVNGWGTMVNIFCQKSEEHEMWLRELVDGFRFAIAHAMLNLKDRKLEAQPKKSDLPDSAHIVPKTDDFNIAFELMREEMKVKYRIIDQLGWREKNKPFSKLTEKMQSQTGEEIRERYRS